MHGYPRPQLYRRSWTCLNGTWDFALDAGSTWHSPSQVAWERTIEVPFAPETALSGIEERGFFRSCWYRRTFAVPRLDPGQRLVLHFGAVDYAATVWVNGLLATRHEGGYTPFWTDVTDLLVADEDQEIVVRADDDPSELAKPRGKQDWELNPHSIWYPRTSGIWQTVWTEIVPSSSIASLSWSASLSQWDIGLLARVQCGPTEALSLKVCLRIGNLTLANDSYAVISGEVKRRIALSDPGIDDSRNGLLWSPSTPSLIQAVVELVDRDGNVIDSVESYTAIREITVEADRFLLNGRPYPLRMVLDQGYWPESGMTAPDDASLRRDVELAKRMGFNGVRKHQKIEDPRYLYWADRLGLLVWEEMPSAYRFTDDSVSRLTREWTAVLRRDASHPCIIAWVPFNESWGVPNLPDNESERSYVRALYHLTHTYDPTRPVIGNDGWESVATDIIGIHDYDPVPERIAARYVTELRPRLFKHERPGGRVLFLGSEGTQLEHPIVLSEFGGIALSSDTRGTWGYSRCSSAKELARRYAALLRVVNSLELLAGFCYTQFADTYQETNGLLYADRTPKFPLDAMARATRGRARTVDGPPLAEPRPVPVTFDEEDLDGIG
jgi:beta-galactosidase/beta-glucuronidase